MQPRVPDEINLQRDLNQFKDNLFKEIVAQLADPSVARSTALSIIRNIHALHAKLLHSLTQHQISKNIIDDESRRTLNYLCDPKLVQSEYKIVGQLTKLKVYVGGHISVYFGFHL